MHVPSQRVGVSIRVLQHILANRFVLSFATNSVSIVDEEGFSSQPEDEVKKSESIVSRIEVLESIFCYLKYLSRYSRAFRSLFMTVASSLTERFFGSMSRAKSPV